MSTDNKVPTYSCRVASGFTFNFIPWDENDHDHDSSFRKIQINFTTVPPADDEIKECGDYLHTTGKEIQLYGQHRLEARVGIQ